MNYPPHLALVSPSSIPKPAAAAASLDHSTMEVNKDTTEPYLSSPVPAITARWWCKDTVAVVTGANRGIGFSMVKQLAQLGLTVILTARDLEKGKKAVELLKKPGLARPLPPP
ncbi:hypothetical protein OIU76_016012 [Salix suchowensis]|nr:hypothetical protein OIU76_016012 [Salix suchowensis]